ncbi:MAG: dihydroorotate dehydrogenase electron transfer subunit, partial [Thermoguttaceae bacterium]|nr:dihydroorotate dehydrogenase electron transfer subunit [Thermoguttaceae bacterium]
MACGPTPMLKAVWHVAEKKNLRCWVSLESAMSCGLGICYGCAIEYLVSDKTWDYRRVCVDGPVFDAWRLKWD